MTKFYYIFLILIKYTFVAFIFFLNKLIKISSKVFELKKIVRVKINKKNKFLKLL
jgi:hypothetical protein